MKENKQTKKNQKESFPFKWHQVLGTNMGQRSSLCSRDRVSIHLTITRPSSAGTQFMPPPIRSHLKDSPQTLHHQSPPALINNCLQRTAACAVSRFVLIEKHSARKDWVAPALESAKENKAGISGPRLLCWGWEKGSIAGWETAHRDVDLWSYLTTIISTG